MPKTYDVSGWATKNNILCADGRRIGKDAFKDQDGTIVPVVWNHNHDSIDNVLGHALLENREEGVYAYVSFNDTDMGRNAKAACNHGDITAFSICANKLKHDSNRVVKHGIIRELSLVLAGANPGALINTLEVSHDEEGLETAEMFNGSEDELEYNVIKHSDDEPEEPEQEPESNEEGNAEENLEHADDANKEANMAEEGKKPETGDKTVAEVFDKAMNKLDEEEQTAVYAVMGALAEGDNDDDSEGGNVMKHNAFEGGQETSTMLSHADEVEIVGLAKDLGTWKKAMASLAQTDSLQHDAVAGGFAQPASGQTGDVTYLFPEYKDVRPGAPELVTDDQGWINTILSGVQKSPISRVRTRQVDIRNLDALRAKGYQKGKQKRLAGNFRLAQRTTDPQTIYVKNALHRDDIIDITDFDYVNYLYNIDKMMLNEELATAIVFGDGRDDADQDKIFEEHIRPVYKDDELYTIHRTLDLAAARQSLQGSETSQHFSDNYIYAEAMIEAVLYARETYKGSGSPVALMHPHTLNVMLLARDFNGRRIYGTVSELAAALNVSKIETVEQMASKSRTVTVEGVEKTYKPLLIMMNFKDYQLGATKGGEIHHFTQFDIDFNQEKSLIETRVSGANTRIYSAIAIEEEVVASNANPEG